MAYQIMHFATLDSERAQAMGVVTVRHTQLDRILRMVIKSITGMDLLEVLAELVRKPSIRLRERIIKEARKTIGDGAALTALQGILTRCEQVSDRRNELTHSVVAVPPGGRLDAMMLNEQEQWVPIPSAEEMLALAADIYAIAEELNRERMEGFLQKAIDAARSK